MKINALLIYTRSILGGAVCISNGDVLVVRRINRPIGTEGLLPIHIAAREGHLQVLRFLHSNGAYIQGVDAHGSNSLHFAARAGQIRSVRWLLRHGVNPILNSNLESPAQLAAQFHHSEVINESRNNVVYTQVMLVDCVSHNPAFTFSKRKNCRYNIRHACLTDCLSTGKAR